MATIKLKVRCTSCDGTGRYQAYNDPDGVPCWHCEGKGWHASSMTPPNPRWAIEYRVRERTISTQRKQTSAST